MVHNITKAERKERLAALAGYRLYSLGDAEQVLGISHRTIQNYITDGSIKATKIGGRWRITEEELKRVATEGTHDTGTKSKPKKSAKKKAAASAI